MKKIACVAALATIAFANQAAARDNILIVGSSTVYPFATAVATEFARAGNTAPTIQSTGSGGGMRLFCAGVGLEHPDITNASRRMKASEQDACEENNIGRVVEVVIGFDGIVVANARTASPLALTRESLFRALVDGSAAQTWADVDPSLPNVAIEVLGPPPTSGTRDAFEELAMEEGCEAANANGGAFDCDNISIRTDGWVDAGENDNAIVGRLTANEDQVGVFGYSFLDQNSGVLQGAVVDGVAPTFDAIASGDYPVARSLYFYVKVAHMQSVPGMFSYLREFVSEDAIGADGYLTPKGLIPLPADERDAMRRGALTLRAMPQL